MLLSFPAVSRGHHSLPARNFLRTIRAVVLHGSQDEGSDRRSVDLGGVAALGDEQGGQDGVAAAVDERVSADGALRSVVGHHLDVVLDAVAPEHVSARQNAPVLDDAFGVGRADIFVADGAHLVCRICFFLLGLLDLLLLFDFLGPAAVLAFRGGGEVFVGGGHGPGVE